MKNNNRRWETEKIRDIAGSKRKWRRLIKKI